MPNELDAMTKQSFLHEIEEKFRDKTYKEAADWLDIRVEELVAISNAQSSGHDTVLNGRGNHIVISVNEETVLRWSEKPYKTETLMRWFGTGGSRWLTSDVPEVRSCFAQLLELNKQPHANAINQTLEAAGSETLAIKFLLWKRYDRFDFSKPLGHRNAIVKLERVSFALGIMSMEAQGHFDVKPHNFLVSGDRLVLNDHETARLIEGSYEVPVGTHSFGHPDDDKLEFAISRDSVAFAKSYLLIRLGEGIDVVDSILRKASFPSIEHDLDKLLQQKKIEPFEFIWLHVMLNPKPETRNARFDWFYLKRLSDYAESIQEHSKEQLEDHAKWYHALRTVFLQLIESEKQQVPKKASHLILDIVEGLSRKWLNLELLDWDGLDSLLVHETQQSKKRSEKEKSSWEIIRENVAPPTIEKTAKAYGVSLVQADAGPPTAERHIVISLISDERHNLHADATKLAYGLSSLVEGKQDQWLKDFPTLGILAHQDSNIIYFNKSRLEILQFRYPTASTLLVANTDTSKRSGAQKNSDDGNKVSWAEKRVEEDEKIKAEKFLDAFWREVSQADAIVFPEECTDESFIVNCVNALRRPLATDGNQEHLPLKQVVLCKKAFADRLQTLSKTRFAFYELKDGSDLLTTIDRRLSETARLIERDRLSCLMRMKRDEQPATEAITKWSSSSTSLLFSESFRELLQKILNGKDAIDSASIKPSVENKRELINGFLLIAFLVFILIVIFISVIVTRGGWENV